MYYALLISKGKKKKKLVFINHFVACYNFGAYIFFLRSICLFYSENFKYVSYKFNFHDVYTPFFVMEEEM